MSYLRERLRKGFRLHLAILELLAFILGLSALALTQQTAIVWLVGIVMIVLHTILFYRMGTVSERLRSERTPDFFRGLKRGLMGRPD